MDASEGINSTNEERFLSRMEKDKDQAYRNVVQQSIYEEKLANNGLFASVFIHIFIILSTISIILFKTNLITVGQDDGNSSEAINFSLFHFNTQHFKNKSNSYSLLCIEATTKQIDPVTNDTYSQCILKDSCVQKGLNTTYIREVLEFDCDIFVDFKILGFIVIYLCHYF